MLICNDPKDSQFEISIDVNNSNGVREIIKIEQTHVKKLLEIMLDERLSFSDHMNYVKKIAMSNLNKIRYLFEKQFGMPTHLALNLFTSYLRSVG